MPKIKQHILGVVMGLLAAGLSGGCALHYKPDIQQGNVLTQEMIDQLRPGMTPRQVRFVLGTPLITDPFHKERWDYYYFFKKGDASEVERRQLTIIFKDDQVIEVRNKELPEPEGGWATPESKIYGKNASTSSPAGPATGIGG